MSLSWLFCSMLCTSAAPQMDWYTRTLTLVARADGRLIVGVQSTPAQSAATLERAREVAVAALIAAVGALPLSDERSLGEALAERPELSATLAALARDFRVLGSRFDAHGGVELTVQLALSAPLVARLVAGLCGRAGPLPRVPGGYTGIVIDGRDLQPAPRPALLPRLLDGAGRPIFDAHSPAVDLCAQNGPLAYVGSLEAALIDPRVADRPLVLRPRAVHGRCDLVLTEADRARLLPLTALLSAARMVWVLP